MERDDAPAYAAALSAPGRDVHLLDGGARVMVEELSDGTVRLTGNGIVGGTAPTCTERRHHRSEGLTLLWAGPMATAEELAFG
jgi:hypothetical protein